ncbi:fungal-specific transcription factor domain-containing protein [Fomitopsis betulina]|nr:fungal-specific transcription factor domain-containing protein [Fomitopsis betulina]
MVLHPCFHVGHWIQRFEAMISWGEDGSAGSSPVQASAGEANMREHARDIFYGGSPGKKAKAPQPRPTLSFFASACAGLALGALVASKANPASLGHNRSPTSQHSGSRPGTSSSRAQDEPSEAERCDHAALFALSEQAMGLAERTAAYDVDAVVTMLLQVLYLLHCYPGGMSVQQGVFPLVGKMINVARMMGLANDPDDFPGTYSLFDAEARRRLWWDVFYYDLFVSDCMGHPPLIPDNSFTTHLPADVDEDAFSPSSTVLPAPCENVDGPDKSSAYFTLKCRLAQLVKNVKKQTFRDPLSDDISRPHSVSSSIAIGPSLRSRLRPPLVPCCLRRRASLPSLRIGSF